MSWVPAFAETTAVVCYPHEIYVKSGSVKNVVLSYIQTDTIFDNMGTGTAPIVLM